MSSFSDWNTAGVLDDVVTLITTAKYRLSRSAYVYIKLVQTSYSTRFRDVPVLRAWGREVEIGRAGENIFEIWNANAVSCVLIMDSWEFKFFDKRIIFADRAMIAEIPDLPSYRNAWQPSLFSFVNQVVVTMNKFSC
jgi:hypothetical protein